MKKKLTAGPAPARRSLGEGGFFNLRALSVLLICAAAAYSMISGALPTTAGKLGFFRPEAPTKFLTELSRLQST